MFVGKGPKGMVGLEPKTYKFIPYKKPRGGKTGRAETKKTDNYDISLEIQDDGSEVMVNDGQGLTRFAALEIKLIPARFGQLKKELFTKLEWDGTKVDYTPNTAKLPTQSEQQWLAGVMAAVNSNTLQTWLKNLIDSMNVVMKNFHNNEHMKNNGCLPLKGNLVSFDFTQSIYKQLGAAYTFDQNQGPTMGGQPVGEELARLAIKGATFSFQGERITFQDGIPSAPNGISENTPIDGNEWVKYMSKTKDILIAGRNTPSSNPEPPGCEGYIYSLNSNFSTIFPMWQFPDTLNLTCRLDASTGMWRFETDGASTVPTYGVKFEDEIELYESLLEAHPSYRSDKAKAQRKLGTRQPQSVNPKRPLQMDPQGNLSPDLNLERRKRKYSIVSRLLGKK